MQQQVVWSRVVVERVAIEWLLFALSRWLMPAVVPCLLIWWVASPVIEESSVLNTDGTKSFGDLLMLKAISLVKSSPQPYNASVEIHPMSSFIPCSYVETLQTF